MITMHNEDIDTNFGIQGLSEDSLFSEDMLLVYDGGVIKVKEIDGSETIFEEIDFTDTDMIRAKANMYQFNNQMWKTLLGKQ
jgi:hypothetical protein